MSLKRISVPERLVTHGTLIAGAIIFSFPFLWMTCVSLKLQREMAPERLRILPEAPRPQDRTPYIDPNEFNPPTRPDGIPEKVWAAARPQLEALLGRIVDRWQPRVIGPDSNPPPAQVRPDIYRREMVQGLFRQLQPLFSDKARQKAFDTEKELRAGNGVGNIRLGERDLMRQLSPESVDAGVAALLDDASRLADGRMLRQVFDLCYRRLALGQVRVRTRDYAFHSLYYGREWTVRSGPATLVGRVEKAAPVKEARIDFSGNGRPSPATTFEMAPTLPVPQDRIDRLYVGLRPDASWADIRFEVIRGGCLFRTKTKSELATADPLEYELRWADDPNTMARRVYLLLHPAGSAPAGSPDFAVRLRVAKSTRAAAWWAKITRNYRQAFREVNFARYVATSLALSILNIILSVFSCTLVAYAFARLEWPGRNLAFGILLATMMLPGQVTMIPTFLVHKWLGWYNTLLPMWVGSAFGSAFFIFLLRQFLKNVPRDLEDAARIDGCGFLRVYWHVMMPLVKPTVATIGIFTFMGVWNDFMGPLIYVSDERLFPLALGIFKLNLQGLGDVGLMMAGSFIMTLPIIVLFFFAQRYFIQGVSLTGMKG